MYKATFILSIIATLVFSVFGCDDGDPSGNPDGSTDTDTDSDSDSDTDTDSDSDTDTDSDSDGDVGDDCLTMVQGGMLSLPGECAASETDCTAGVGEDIQGDCNSGLTCCLTEDACEIGGQGMTECQADECALGFQAGCPDNGWCCVDQGSGDSGPGTQDAGEGCEVSVMGYLTLTGSCQDIATACEGGYFPGQEQGNCYVGLGCCIATDQCDAATSGMLSCQSDPCTGVGFQVGCPSNGYCCM